MSKRITKRIEADEQQTEQQPTATPEEQPAAAQDKGILANDHDNDKLGKDIAKLLDGLAKRGVAISLERIDLNNLKARIESYAACQMLVAKGICSEAEMAAACNREFRAILATILQLVEEQRLSAASEIQTVRKPPIQIARLRD